VGNSLLGPGLEISSASAKVSGSSKANPQRPEIFMNIIVCIRTVSNSSNTLQREVQRVECQCDFQQKTPPEVRLPAPCFRGSVRIFCSCEMLVHAKPS